MTINIYKGTRSKNFYFTIIDYVKKHNKLPKNLCSKQCLNYYIKTLKRLSILIKRGYGVWEINEENIKYLDSERSKNFKVNQHMLSHVEEVKKNRINIRGHGFVYSVKIPKISNWENREKFLISQKISYKQIKNYQRITFKNHKIWLLDTKLRIFIPKGLSFYGTSANDCRYYALYDLFELLKGLENLFKVSFRINKEYKVEIKRQHYAKVDDPLAKEYNKKHKKLEVRSTKDNKVWLLIDNSFNLHELETVHPETANSDMDNIIVPYFQDIEDYTKKTGELPKPSAMINMINQLIEYQRDYAENISAHIDAIKTLAKQQEEQTKINKELKNLISIILKKI